MKQKPKKDKKLPSLKRSIITAGLLLLLSLALYVTVYVLAFIGGAFPLEYALFCAFCDFVLMSFLLMLPPLLIGTIKKDCSLKFVETMPWICCLSTVVLVNAVTDPTSGAAWVQALIYSIICKHILIQMHKKIQHRKRRIITVCAALLVHLFVLIGGLLGFVAIETLQSNVLVTTDDIQSNKRYYIGDVHLETEKPSGDIYYKDINGNLKLIKYSIYYKDKYGNLIRINE